MANKDTRCSFRLSEEVYDLLLKQPGDTLTAKFEYLIRFCIKELPAAQFELKNVRRQIENESKHLRVLRDQKAALAQNVNSVNYSLKALVSQVDRAVSAIEKTGVTE